MTIDRFNESLRSINSRISCRYNPVRSRYEVVWDNGRETKDIIYAIPFGGLSAFAPEVLKGLNINKNLSAKERLAMIEEEEDREEKLAEKRIADDLEHITSENYDTLQRLEGRRITLPDCGFECNDKRRVTIEA